MKLKAWLNEKTTDFCKNSYGEDITIKETIGYSIAGFGQNLICGIVGTFIMVFMTEALGFNANKTIFGVAASTLVAYLMLGCRVFDAFNDPIMGSIVDRTRTKFGKCRPYLKWTPIPIAIMTILCFLPIYPATKTGFIAISAVYVIWSVVYTIIDVPYWGLSTAMSADTDYRARLLMIARLLCTAGAGLIQVLLPAIATALTKDYYYEQIDEYGNTISILNPEFSAQNMTTLQWFYFTCAVIVAIVAIPMFLYGFKTSKERYISDKPAPSLGHNLKLLFKNTPLMMVVLSGILGCARMVYTGTAAIYFTKYALHHEGWFSIVTMLVIPGGLIASVLCPLLQKKFGKKWTYIVTHLVGGIIMVIMYFVGWRTTGGLIFTAVGLVLLGIPQGINNIMCYAMIGDTVDYLEDKTGERAEGICFAMQTFINKMGLAATAFIGVIIYAPCGIDAEAGTIADPQLLWQVMILSGAVSMIACCIPMFFYRFTEKKQREAIERIQARKAAKMEKEKVDDGSPKYMIGADALAFAKEMYGDDVAKSLEI